MPALLSALQSAVFVGAVTLANLAGAADELPNFDVGPNCQAASKAAVSNNRDEAACKRDEQTARDKLQQEWGQFNTTQRGHCVRLSALGGSPSYVELLTCLEMAKAADELPDDALNARGQVGR